MSLEARFFGSLVYPAYHALKRDTVMARIAEYERNQWLSPTELQAVQCAKLDQLIRHATRHVPYYRRRLGNIAAAGVTPASLARLPPLTKADIRNFHGLLRAENADPKQLGANSTSGSTGEPLYFYTDTRSGDCRKASVVRNKRWMGVDIGDRELWLWGSPIDVTRSARLRGRVHGWLMRTRLVSAYDLSRPRLRECLAALHAYRPRLLVAYPSVLEELARELAASGRSPSHVRAILVSAETLFPHQRELFERVFGAPVFNRYGCREVGDIAHECAHHAGLHINSDRVLVEVVREDLTACDPGEVGNVLVTDLDNYAMPLIRYSIGDRAAFAAPGACACGRGLARLESIEGRTLDVVRFPNGSAVGGTYWTILLRKRPDMHQFQVVQQRPDEITIKYVAPAPLPAETARMIRQQVAMRAGERFAVSFEQVENIPVNAGGKRRIVVNELPLESPQRQAVRQANLAK